MCQTEQKPENQAHGSFPSLSLPGPEYQATTLILPAFISGALIEFGLSATSMF